MSRTLVTVIVTVVAVLFAVQNFDHVPVYIMWGKAIQIRLVFLIALAGAGGYMVRHFVGIRREEELRRRCRRLEASNRKKRRRTFTDDSDWDDGEELA